MTIINTTFHVEKSIADQFVKWVRERYIPTALSSGELSSPSFSSIMLEVADGCSSYAVSFKSGTQQSASKWHDGSGADLRQELNDQFGQRALFFTTYMEELPL